jgi:hypothetical protein
MTERVLPPQRTATALVQQVLMSTKKTPTPAASAAASSTRRPAPVRGRASADQPPRASGAQPAPADDERHTAHDRAVAAADPTHGEIAEAAYGRYLARGGVDGYDVDDWMEAERELRRR